MTDRTHYVGCWREHHECAELLIGKIKSRKYECFIEDHEPRPWTPGRCGDYAGRSLHLMRCKRKDGHGVGGLFCRQHADLFRSDLYRTAAETSPAAQGGGTTSPSAATLKGQSHD